MANRFTSTTRQKSAANEILGSQNAEPSTAESSSYSRLSDNKETYVLEESETSADELAITSFSHPPKQPDSSTGELSLSLYAVEEPESSGDEVVFISFSRPIEDDSADELALNTNTNPMAFKRRPGRESKKAISKALCHLSDQSSRDDASLLESDDSQSSHAASRDITLDTVLSHRTKGAFKSQGKGVGL
jgi:hypothetical protein